MRRLLLLALILALVLPGAAVEAEDAPGVPLIALDPGHGGNDYGTSGVVGDKRLLEKELTLAVARQAADRLQKAGYRVMLTRSSDTVAGGDQDRTSDGKVDLADQLQARVDRANEAKANVLVSIHFNGSLDRSLRGPEAYYSAARPFAGESRKLADSVLNAITTRLGEAGKPVRPLGVKRDSTLGGTLFLLGPEGGRIARASTMPAVLVETLFLTNEEDARLLAESGTVEILSRAYADGIMAYLGPPPKPAPKRATVSAVQGAYLRPSPLLGTTPMTTLPPGTVVELAEPARGDAVGGSADWWRVDVKGQAGYVFGRLLAPAAPPSHAAAEPTRPPVPSPTPVAARVTVRTDDGLPARIRSEPSRQAPIAARAQSGESLELLGQADGEAVEAGQARWVKVRRGSVVGWVWAGLTL